MADYDPATEQTIVKSIEIKATPSTVWQALTKPELMQQWMSESTLEILTTWTVGDTITIKGGWYKTGFENRGTVLQFQPHSHLAYSHLSSLSKLPDEPGNYTVVAFGLMPAAEGTVLTLELSNFPTETIYKHFAFYWNVTLVLLKNFIEQQMAKAMPSKVLWHL